MNTERELGPDVVRAAAALLVICVHFFLNAGFYELPLLNGMQAPYRQKLLLAPAVVAVDFVFAAVPAFAADTAARKIAGRLPEKRKKDET